MLFPIIVKGKPIGLIYADRAEPGDIMIPEKELLLLKSLQPGRAGDQTVSLTPTGIAR